MSALPVNTSSAALRAFAVVLIASVLPACSLLGGKKEPPRQFAPVVHVAADASWPRVDAQLTIAPPQIIRSYDTLRIAVRPTPQELEVYKGGVWAQRPSEMLTASLLHTFEDAARLRAVARDNAGVSGDFRLLLDIRRFEADYAGAATPNATIEVSAKLVRKDGTDVVASRTFLQAERATDTTVPQVVDAFDRALVRMDHDIAGWTLMSMAGTRK